MLRSSQSETFGTASERSLPTTPPVLGQVWATRDSLRLFRREISSLGPTQNGGRRWEAHIRGWSDWADLVLNGPDLSRLTRLARSEGPSHQLGQDRPMARVNLVLEGFMHRCLTDLTTHGGFVNTLCVGWARIHNGLVMDQPIWLRGSAHMTRFDPLAKWLRTYFMWVGFLTGKWEK